MVLLKKDSTTWGIFENQLGFNNLQKSGSYAIKTIQFVNANQDTKDSSTKTNVVITLNDGYTWSKTLDATTGDNNFSINENNALEVKNVTLPFDFTIDKNPKAYFNIDNGIITRLTDEGKKLQNITIPNDPEITRIGEFAFSNSKTTDVYPSSSATNPENPNTTLQTISIPSNIKTIGKGAFFNCSNLTNVTFTKTSQLMSIGDSAFKYTTKLSSIEIPASVKQIDQKAFHSSSLTSIKFLGKNVKMGQAVFANCKSLTDVTLPSELTAIPDFTFGNTEKLTSLSVLSTVETIGISSFNGSKISTLDLSNTKIKTISNSAFANTTSLTTIQLPSQLQTIEINAFRNSGLTSISIPQTVTNISYSSKGEFASSFQDCKSLTSVTFEGNTSRDSNVTKDLTIGQFTFAGSSALHELTFPSRTKIIKANAISGSGVKSVTLLGTSDPEIWANSFAGVSSLNIYVEDSGLKSKLQSWFSEHASGLGVTVKEISEKGSLNLNHSFFSTSF